MATPSLADRLQSVTNQKKHEEHMAKSFDELSRMTIAFGEAKVGMTYLEVIEKDPKYAQWFARKYANSTKETHRSFLHFLSLYVERQELMQEGDQCQVPLTPRPKMELKAKSRAAPPPCPEVGSQDSWSEPDLSWEPPYTASNQQITEEVQMQSQRINQMEGMLCQISQQLQMLMPNAPANTVSK